MNRLIEVRGWGHRQVDIYAIETLGGAVWYAVTRYLARRGPHRLVIHRYTGYREPS